MIARESALRNVLVRVGVMQGRFPEAIARSERTRCREGVYFVLDIIQCVITGGAGVGVPQSFVMHFMAGIDTTVVVLH